MEHIKLGNIIRPCPVCKLGAEELPNRGRLASEIECPRCGQYSISSTAEAVLEHRPDTFRYAMSARLRAYTERGESPPMVMDADLDGYLTDSSVPRRISDRIDAFLISTHKRMGRIGVPAQFSVHDDYPLFHCKDDSEFHHFLMLALNMGLVTVGSRDASGRVPVELTTSGWMRLDELQGPAPATGHQCFVAMRFSEEMAPVYQQGMEPAIRECGYEPIRVDRVEHNNKICDLIIAELKRSRLVVADFTFNRGGVYFEAGYALGLGVPVIWTRRATASDELHFDTRQYNHIEWTTPEDLRVKLKARIEATARLKA
ncbi:MAG: hypothetical protein L6R43_00475 [Planctomycetes bacterium]|nr:hypothetical protein [Planctomycetota bacterium]